MEEQNKQQQLILHWKANPHRFVTDVFGVALEPFQEQALRALACDPSVDPSQRGRVSIRSGHGVGKSTLAAWSVLWFISTHFPCKIPCTAPTAHQLEDILWAEIGNWFRRMPPALQASFTLKSDRLELKGREDSSFAVARTARKEQPEALQGFHAENLLFVIDEASGVDEIVFEVAEGALSTPGAKVLMTANPTRTSGYFYDSHHRMRHRWYNVKVGCTESSRVAPEYAEDMAAKYGPESNVYRVRVLGEFPASEDDVVVPLSLAEAAVYRDVRPIDVPVVWGVDVARFGGDRCALAKRQGNALLENVQSWRGYDLMASAGRIVDEYKRTHPRERPVLILVDVIGLGAGLVDRLDELGLPVMGVNVGEAASRNGRYMRLRDELWFMAREWFEAMDCTMPDDDELIGEITSVKYKFTSSGKLQVESKDEMAKRGMRSPDLADAFCCTFAVDARMMGQSDDDYNDHAYSGADGRSEVGGY